MFCIETAYMGNSKSNNIGIKNFILPSCNFIDLYTPYAL